MTPSRTATPSPTLPPLPVGLDALVDLDSIAELRPPGMRVEQVSSYDRSGGNVDFGVGPDTADLLRKVGAEPTEIDNSYLYRDGDRYVVFDELGPGVVYRIWMTGLDALFLGGLQGDIAFELDDEPAPRLQLPRAELFSGQRAPFVTPLAGDNKASAGGFYSVVPIPFAKRLRITTSTVPNWMHVTYAKLPPGTAVESFDPVADSGAAAAVLADVGHDPKKAVPTREDEVDLDVAPGAAQAVWETGGAGAILRLELTAPAGAEIPLGLRLQAFFDGASAPQFDAPLDDLFGASLGPAARSLAFGRDGDRFYFYFPMPYHRGSAPLSPQPGRRAVRRMANPRGVDDRGAFAARRDSPCALGERASRAGRARLHPARYRGDRARRRRRAHRRLRRRRALPARAAPRDRRRPSRRRRARVDRRQPLSADPRHRPGGLLQRRLLLPRRPRDAADARQPGPGPPPLRAVPASTCAAPTASSSATRSRSRATSGWESSTGR